MATVEIIDALMGTGKSTWAIEGIKKPLTSVPKVIVVPLLSEVERYTEALADDSILSLGDKSTPHKLELFKDALVEEKTIITTHALFQLFDEECFDLIEDMGFELYLDETASLVAGNQISPSDFKALSGGLWVSTEGTVVKNLDKVLPAGNIEDYEGKHQSFIDLVISGHIFVMRSAEGNKDVVSFVMPPEKITCFSSAKILTYLFKGTETEAWLKLFKIDYKHLSLVRDTSGTAMSWELSEHDGSYSGSQFAQLINICDDRKLNAVGVRKTSRSKQPLSRSWYMSPAAKTSGIKRLSLNLISFFRGTDRSDIIWTCPKILERRMANRHFSSVKESTWLAVNTRATNNFADRHKLAICQNLFPLMPVQKFFQLHGIKLNPEHHALSMMVQWIFRSAIRKGDQVNLYLPSERMRGILETWLNTEQELQKAA